MYMLDTNVLSAIGRDPEGLLARRLAVVDAEVSVSSIVLGEIVYGVENNPAAQSSGRTLAAVNLLNVAPFDAAAAMAYGRIRAELRRAGTPIGANDMLIAAHAVALDATLVTDNVKEFSRVPGLKLENWMR